MDILIADDDVSVAKFIAFLLEDAGYHVIKAYDGPGTIQALARSHPDLVLLDVMMPSMSGFDVCRQIRQTNDVPIIFLSCAGRVEDRVMGLAVGGDDYVVKPFEPAELLARIAAVLRRCTTTAPEIAPQLSIGGVTLMPVVQQAIVDNRDIALTPIEFHLLHYLMSNAGHVLSGYQILSTIWGEQRSQATSLLTTYINRLRTKIELDATHPTRIITVRNFGYEYRLVERVMGER